MSKFLIKNLRNNIKYMIILSTCKKFIMIYLYYYLIIIYLFNYALKLRKYLKQNKKQTFSLSFYIGFYIKKVSKSLKFALLISLQCTDKQSIIAFKHFLVENSMRFCFRREFSDVKHVDTLKGFSGQRAA